MFLLSPPELATDSWTIQWPDNFDFETTRTISRPTPSIHSHYEDIKQQSARRKQGGENATITVNPASESSVSVTSGSQGDFDPVALTKAFKFATYSSLSLVCVLF